MLTDMFIWAIPMFLCFAHIPLNLLSPCSCPNVALNIVIVPASAAFPCSSFHVPTTFGVGNVVSPFPFVLFPSLCLCPLVLVSPILGRMNCDHSPYQCPSRFCVPLVSSLLNLLHYRENRRGLCAK